MTWNYKINKPFLAQIAFGMVFYHSNRYQLEQAGCCCDGPDHVVLERTVERCPRFALEMPLSIQHLLSCSVAVWKNAGAIADSGGGACESSGNVRVKDCQDHTFMPELRLCGSETVASLG